MSLGPSNPATTPSAAVTGPPDPFDVPRLIADSQPAGGTGRGVLLLPPLGLGAMLGAMLVLTLAPQHPAWTALVAMLLLAVSLGVTYYLARLAKRVRLEKQQVEEIEELILLRHFPQAAGRLVRLLSGPMQMPPIRVAALVQLARVLMRFGRFEEAIDVAEAVLEDRSADPGTRFAVGCGRAMALLRSDRLFDAGEAITSLRREVNRVDESVQRVAREVREAREAREAHEARQARVAGDARESDSSPDEPLPGPPVPQTLAQMLDEKDDAAMPPRFDSATLTVVEMYRDIQTRHSEEALAGFEQRRDTLRHQLGIRFADPLALASVAAHRLGRHDEAARLWADATCLTPADELRRRYPELEEVAAIYAETPRPPMQAPAERQVGGDA